MKLLSRYAVIFVALLFMCSSAWADNYTDTKRSVSASVDAEFSAKTGFDTRVLAIEPNIQVAVFATTEPVELGNDQCRTR